MGRICHPNAYRWGWQLWGTASASSSMAWQSKQELTRVVPGAEKGTGRGSSTGSHFDIYEDETGGRGGAKVGWGERAAPARLGRVCNRPSELARIQIPLSSDLSLGIWLLQANGVNNSRTTVHASIDPSTIASTCTFLPFPPISDPATRLRTNLPRGKTFSLRISAGLSSCGPVLVQAQAGPTDRVYLPSGAS